MAGGVHRQNCQALLRGDYPGDGMRHFHSVEIVMARRNIFHDPPALLAEFFDRFAKRGIAASWTYKFGSGYLSAAIGSEAQEILFAAFRRRSHTRSAALRDPDEHAPLGSSHVLNTLKTRPAIRRCS